MKTIFLFLGMTLFFIQGCSTATVQDGAISGHIENNSEYRGGANPPEFLLAELAQYRPSANQVFYVRNAANYAPFTTVIASFATDANGHYTLDLPNGNYAVIGQDKFGFEQHPEAGVDCDYLSEPDFILTINSTQHDYTSQFTIKRNNCTTELPN